jgi:hypothetical protein
MMNPSPDSPANDVDLGLGAFNGNSSIPLSRPAGDEGKVYAFEPNPLIQACIRPMTQ